MERESDLINRCQGNQDDCMFLHSQSGFHAHQTRLIFLHIGDGDDPVGVCIRSTHGHIRCCVQQTMSLITLLLLSQPTAFVPTHLVTVRHCLTLFVMVGYSW